MCDPGGEHQVIKVRRSERACLAACNQCVKMQHTAHHSKRSLVVALRFGRNRNSISRLNSGRLYNGGRTRLCFLGVRPPRAPREAASLGAPRTKGKRSTERPPTRLREGAQAAALRRGESRDVIDGAGRLGGARRLRTGKR